MIEMTKEQYEKLLKSGLMWEIFPQWIGNYKEDILIPAIRRELRIAHERHSVAIYTCVKRTDEIQELMKEAGITEREDQFILIRNVDYERTRKN